ncbi:hypothetical protein [Pseudarthrobacter albicanus]|uniref:hypothetical protein n=1 Tax=Pseudarthrobacter albicanus TaxID=2823873 RepID=UPI001BA44883|nr:hypothetical protein [Pseudarthrobacter albicanus]
MSRAQEYRLRSFEAAYVEPQIQFLDDHYGRAWTDVKDDPHGRSGEGVLHLFLLREAVNWIQFGRLHGFFSPDLDPFPIPFDWSSGLELPFSGEISQERLYDIWSKDWGRTSIDRTFDEALTVATDALSDERLEFLRLYLFADESEWEHKVSELEDSQNLLQASEKDPSREERMDSVAWAFQGAESDLPYLGCPSDWRAGASDWRIGTFSDLRRDGSRAKRLMDVFGGIEDRIMYVVKLEAEHSLAEGEDIQDAPLHEAYPEDFRYWGGDGNANQ